MSVEQLINFEIFISTNEIFLNIHYYPSQYFFDLEEIIFENFNICVALTFHNEQPGETMVAYPPLLAIGNLT